MNSALLMENLRSIPDFPIKGILFWDVTTLFKHPDCLREIVDGLYEQYKDAGITKVVGIEARGYVIGSALAMRLGAGFVMARKPGKLPAETWSESYTKEYGEDRLEIHCDAISSDDVVLIHDDLLATGGTVAAVSRLVDRFNPQKQYMGFIISLKDVPRVEAFPEDVETFSLLNL